MASVASQLTEEAAAHAQSDSLDDVREICADGTYFLNNLHTFMTNTTQSETTYHEEIFPT
jgi:hypothetical protein